MPYSPKVGMGLLVEAIEKADGVGYFYICGESYSAQMKLVHDAKDAAMSDGAGDFNYGELDARDLDVDLLFDILNFPPILSQRRVLVIHCADKLNVEARQRLNLFFYHKFQRELLLLLFNTPHTKPDEQLLRDDRFTTVQCD